MIHNMLITYLSWNQIVALFPCRFISSFCTHHAGGNEPGNEASKIVGIV